MTVYIKFASYSINLNGMNYYSQQARVISKWERVRNAVPYIIAICISILSIQLNYKGVKTDNGRDVLYYWPNIRVPLVMTLLTWFYAKYCVQKFRLDGREESNFSFSEYIIGFCFGLAPVFELLLYPGLEQLHMSSDPALLGALSALTTTQAFFLYRIMKSDLDQEIDFKTIALGTILNLVIVFASAYTHHLSSGGRYEAEIHGE